MARLTKRSVAAVLWHTLIYHSKKQAVRDELPNGSTTPVQVKVTGVIGGQRVSEVMSGRLLVGEPTHVASSVSLATVDVVGYLLSVLPRSRRELELEQLPKVFAKKGTVPGVDETTREQAMALLRQLRTQVTTTRDATIRFEPDGEASGNAKAA